MARLYLSGAKERVITFNRPTTISFIVSFLLHAFLFALLFLSFKTILPPHPPTSKTPTLTLRLNPPMQKQKPTPTSTPRPSTAKPLPAPPPHPLAKPTLKPKTASPLKPTIAKRSSKEHNATKLMQASRRKKQTHKTTSKNKAEKPHRNVRKRPAHVAKKTKPHHIKKKRSLKKERKKGLAGRLLKHATPMRTMPTRNSPAYAQRMIKTLYGKEYDTFTPEQKRFIKSHLDEIRRITQNTLVRNGYPDIAVRTWQQGTNVVTFYLHPNGDISGLRLLRPTGYEALDKNTLEVIEIAYKDYPLPKQKTKIIFYVTYRID